MATNSEWMRRRTFGIVSHPDAGKTTLTEKLLLFGGAIQIAGAVKSNKIKRHVTSDFMEIERQRGISVSTSVMAFEYRNLKINILDTPGHKDFAEDTYRTLSAVDSAIVVIDVAKGVEEQTEKLVEVCRMRSTPMMVFINKLDREGKDPFDLLDEIEQKLQLKVVPLSWPIGMGQRFQGVYDLYKERLLLFEPHGGKNTDKVVEIRSLDREALLPHIGGEATDELLEELQMVRAVYDPFDRDRYRRAELFPVFFGSALNNFGVRELLECYVDNAPPPRPRPAVERIVYPDEEKFTGFVFKIHANIDPKHRDRIAFVRVVSGTFRRNTYYYHVQRDRKLKFANPTMFMAAKKSVIDEAYPGDIVGLYDTGNFKIGDSLTEGEVLHFTGIPRFSPEVFRFINNDNPMKFKQFEKGLRQLMEEGLAQLFELKDGGRKLIGTVGTLQFDVIKYRLEHEYGAQCSYEPYNAYKALWIEADDEEALREFVERRSRHIAYDMEGKPVFLAESPWMLKVVREKHPKVQLRTVNEEVTSLSQAYGA